MALVDVEAQVKTRPGAQVPRIPHLGGLDGLRAIGVMAVVLYHTELGWFAGGFLGVDVFFVVSGYLITSLLLAEWRQSSGIDLAAFWLRRARRLLPAAFFLIIAVLTFSVLFLPDEVAGLRGNAIASFAYVTNWYLIYSRESYFQAAVRPSLLRHLWSLAVEEQFYLVWPLVFAAAMRLLKAQRLFFLTVAGAAASAMLMATLYQPDMDPSRVYYGTDTRAFALLIGAALSFVWTPGSLPEVTGKGARRLVDAVGIAALCVLVACFVWVNDYSPMLYRGGFVLVALVTAALVAASVHPASRLGGIALSWRPLQWVGQRSYAIYLWHWPIFALTRPQMDLPLDGVPLLLLRLPLTLALAELSFRFVETPFRKGALGRAWGMLQTSTGARRRELGLRLALIATVLLLPAAYVTASVAGAEPPPPPSYLSVSSVNTVDHVGSDGQEASILPTATPSEVVPVPTSTPPPQAALTPTPAEGGSATPSPAETGTPAPVPPARPTATPDEDLRPSRPPQNPPTMTPTPVGAIAVLAIGDSVMIGAAAQMQESIPGLAIDAAQGRQSWSAVEILRPYVVAGRVRGTVVIHLGNNYTFTPQQVEGIMQVLAGARNVIFVNVKVPRSWEAATNEALAAAPGLYTGVALVDWHAASVNHPEYFWEDGMHLRPEGAAVYARLIAAAVEAGAANPGPSGATGN
jgi:peptidoglycan/LPS O-acetylase OafA/YrhL